ncbi:hypothetical protein FRUB_00317 [Fimbriiglobus ruber]|uniref:Uncharacterized protein n=2 Tax=Fimbriiglobus ruber TaxID=1908690 RepID=A0A225E746_9BACT|nr:hypothetical protein FRUB_00317 [Fimbriiglobus ruber]
MADLISLDVALQQIPTAPASDYPVIASMISACSTVVGNYCNRIFQKATYSEVFDGTGTAYLLVSNPPLTQVLSVRTGLLPAIYIQCNDPASQTQVASVTVGETGITLFKLYNNVAVTNETFTYADYPTFGSLLAPINALGNGWQASPCTQFNLWQTSDLWLSNTGQTQYPAEGYGPGTYSAKNISLGLQVYWWQLPYFRVNQSAGEIICPAGFVPGFQNYRVDYTGGFDPIPSDIQYAVSCFVQLCYATRQANPLMTSETLDKYSYTKNAEVSLANLGLAAKMILNSYRLITIPGRP